MLKRVISYKNNLTHIQMYVIIIDVLFPLVGWLIEGFVETPLTIGKWR